MIVGARCLGLMAFVTFAVLAACQPSTVAEAEAKGDVVWLDRNGMPDAVAALGRLADTDPKAATALQERSSFDDQAFRVAWVATLRGSAWGPALLHSALADPKRADRAAGVMTKNDAVLPAFVADLESALVRLSGTLQNTHVTRALASAGPTARPAIARRLADGSTRGAMCRGVASGDAGSDAREALYAAPETDRDAPACVDAVVSIAEADDRGLAWLAERGEPGLVGAVSKSDVVSCARLHVAWAKAFASRPVDMYPALTVPLRYAIKRCPADLDGVLADTLARIPPARGLVVRALDPYQSYGGALRATCAALPEIAGGKDDAITRERASDALANTTCKAPG